MASDSLSLQRSLHRVPPLLALALLALLAGGCVRGSHSPYLGPANAATRTAAKPATASVPAERSAEIPATVPASISLAHRHDPSIDRPEPPDLHLEPRREMARHRVWDVRHVRPCTGEPATTARLYLSRTPGPKRWVVVLPIWGSSEYPPRETVRRLLYRDAAPVTNVLWILGPDELFDWGHISAAETEAEYLERVRQGAECLAASVRDARRYFDWILARDDADPERLGVVGYSIGAIAASLLTSVDPRPAAVVLAMGGGRLAETFATCRGDARYGRDAALARFGWTVEDFVRRVEPVLRPVEPLRWAHRADPREILVLEATKDRCIPESGRRELWEALGRPERWALPYGHRMSFLSMTFLGFHLTQHRIANFLDQRLLDERLLDQRLRDASPPDASPPDDAPPTDAVRSGALAGR